MFELQWRTEGNFDDKDRAVPKSPKAVRSMFWKLTARANNGVEQVRELRETCKYAPANSPFKIYIIG